MFVVGRKVNVLSKVEGREKRQELRGEVDVNVIERPRPFSQCWWMNAVYILRAVGHKRNPAWCKIHFPSNTCVLLYW